MERLKGYLRGVWGFQSKEADGSSGRGESGFTLIELVVVLAIIGTLTALIIPRVLAAMNQAYVSTATNTAREIQTAVQVFEEGNSQELPNDWGAAGWQTVSYAQLYGDVGQTIALPADPGQADFSMNLSPDYYTDGNGNYVLIIQARDKDQTEIVLTNPGSPFESNWNWLSGGPSFTNPPATPPFGKSGIFTYDPVTHTYTKVQ